MKCFLCEGEIKAKEITSYEPVFGRDIDGYRPKCAGCHTEFFPDKLFPTPEAALEAMTPKVDEGLVEKTFQFVRSQHEIEKKYCGDDEFYSQKNVIEWQNFIKQELEKYWRGK